MRAVNFPFVGRCFSQNSEPDSIQKIRVKNSNAYKNKDKVKTKSDFAGGKTFLFQGADSIRGVDKRKSLYYNACNGYDGKE